MSFVMKISNFVKSAKTSFLAPLTPKCTRVLRTTAWQAKLKQHNSTHGTDLLLETLSYDFVALLSQCKDGQELENLVLILMRRDFHNHGMTSSHLILRHRRTATGKRKLSNVCLSAKLSKLSFFLVLLFRIIWSNSDASLCHFDILNSFKLLKDCIWHSWLIQ